ncbi:MAG: cytochrome c peroxidase [Gammaproteobacteria bacterium]|nr:cytochrome c peroxidase [Gammaproteobacteria bacterium]
MKLLPKILRNAILVVLASCSQSSLAFEVFSPLPHNAPVPTDNPQTPTRIALGKQLYFDARLSVKNTISCNTCHDLNRGGADGRVRSMGALGKSPRRSTPTVLNAAFQSVQFRDGRAPSLEAAVKDHLFDLDVLANPDEASLVKRITAIKGYRRQFTRAFGKEQSVSTINIAKAVAAYVRTLITPESAFDRYLKGDKKALSENARRGFGEFQKIGCSACHFGINLSGPPVPMGDGFYELFPNYPGSEYDRKYNLVTDDLGRYETTQEDIHKRLFQVPSLRNIAQTAPYFHTGSVPTLDEAVRVMAKTQLQQDLSDEQVTHLVAFLNSLSGTLPD